MSEIKKSTSAIEEHLTPAAKDTFNCIKHLSEVTSTNDYLLKLSQETNDNIICTADHQTHGRGRRGQQWLSQPGDICFSLLWKTELELDKLSGLSLVTAIAIAEALHTAGLPKKIQLKWPNDIFYDNKKLGGILIETTRCNKKTMVVIGIGINQHKLDTNHKLNHDTISLNEITQSKSNSQELIAKIINQLTTHMKDFEKNGLARCVNLWEKYDMTFKQTISVTQNQIKITGTGLGINAAGELLLDDETGIQHAINSGSIQLK
jgi:BirA family transcriptional regulator, biotin operon repressor / biotin---[acetyl-CoA-carboxylase] ligase